MAKVTAVILAAGLSRRMGANKLLLDYNGKPIFQHVLDAIQQSNAAEIIVVSSKISIDKISDIVGASIMLVDNPDYETGMTSSIQKGIERSNPNNGMMICLSDQPLMTAADYNRVIDAYTTSFEQDEKVIVVPFKENKKGNPVIFSPTYRTAILNHNEQEGCKGIIQNNPNHIVKVNFESNAILTDVDTPESYKKLIGKK